MKESRPCASLGHGTQEQLFYQGISAFVEPRDRPQPNEVLLVAVDACRTLTPCRRQRY